MMYSWALQCFQRHPREPGRQKQQKSSMKGESTGIKRRLMFSVLNRHTTIILLFCFKQAWLSTLSWFYESIFPFDRRVIKWMVEHQFLPGTSKKDVRPHRGEWLLHCTLQRRISELFFSSYIHCYNEIAERVQKRTQQLPTLSLPSFLFFWL